MTPETRGLRAAVVFNPAKVSDETLTRTVDSATRQYGWEPSLWFETDSTDGGVSAARAAVAAKPDVVLVAGGDGTVRAVAQEVYRSRIPLALVPAGTGNLLARNLRLPLADMTAAVAAAFSGIDRRVDIAFAGTRGEDGVVTRRVFVVMAGIGLDATMAAHTDPRLKARIGWGAYVDPIARSIIGNRQQRLRYRIDGARTRSLRAHTIIVGNCGTLTANILLLPDAVIDDGLLDVVVFRPRGAFGWARIGSRLATHSILRTSRAGRWMMRRAPDLKALNYVQAPRFHARFDPPQLVQLDGDSIGLVRSIALTVLHQGLTVRVPANPLSSGA